MNALKIPSALIALILCLPVQAELSGSKDKPILNDLTGYLDLAVAETPAFVALGVTPENVIRPGSGRELALGLLRGVDGNGNLQTGIAIETSPYLLARGRELTFNDYRNSLSKRQLSRIKVSFATSSGQSDNDDADRTALGVRWTPWDEGDKRLHKELIECYDRHLTDFGEPPPDLSLAPTVGLVATPEEVEKAAKTCVTAAEKALWNASAWDIGVAGYSVDDDTINESGVSLWSSLALKVGGSGQFIVTGRYHEDLLNKDIDEDGNLDLQDGHVIGARFRWGNEKVALLIEGSTSDIEYTNADRDDKYNDILIGVEHALSKGLWLQLAWGDRSGSDQEGNTENYLSGQLRWAFSQNSLR